MIPGRVPGTTIRVLALLLTILPGLAAGAIQMEGSHAAGDVITITGTTNLAVGDTLQVTVTSASFRHGEKTQAAGFSGASGTVWVVHGTPRNTWAFTFGTSGFRPDAYLVTVESVETGIRETSIFTLAERGWVATGTSPVTPGETVITPPIRAAGIPLPPAPSATPKAGSPPVLLALPVLFFLFLRQRS